MHADCVQRCTHLNTGRTRETTHTHNTQSISNIPRQVTSWQNNIGDETKKFRFQSQSREGSSLPPALKNSAAAAHAFSQLVNRAEPDWPTWTTTNSIHPSIGVLLLVLVCPGQVSATIIIPGFSFWPNERQRAGPSLKETLEEKFQRKIQRTAADRLLNPQVSEIRSVLCLELCQTVKY